MNEQQYKILEDRVSDALLEPLTDAQLEQLDRLMESNPNLTEEQTESFLRSAGVDIEGITKRVTDEFIKEQNIQAQTPPTPPAQPPVPPAPQPPTPPAPQPPVPPQPNLQGAAV